MTEQTKFLVKTTGLLMRYDTKTGNSEILLRVLNQTPDETDPESPEEISTPIYSLVEDYLDPELDAENSMSATILNITGIESLAFLNMAPSRVYSDVDREPEERVLSLFHVAQLAEGTNHSDDKTDLVWFTTQSEEHKVILSNKESTIVLYRDGRIVGDAKLINDHATMITSVM